MPGKHKIPSWQTAAYARLRAAGEDWVQLGELYAAAEHLMLPHHATRFQAKHLRANEDISVETAKWRYFIHTISSMKIEWERVRDRYHSSQPTDLLRLRSEGLCEHCGGKLYRETWSRTSHHTRCAACRAGATRPVVAAETEEEEPMPEEPLRRHPLIGMTVTRYDPTGKGRTRNATIDAIFESHNSNVGDLALLRLRDGSGSEVVPVCEFQDWVTWKLRPDPTVEIDEEAA